MLHLDLVELKSCKMLIQVRILSSDYRQHFAHGSIIWLILFIAMFGFLIHGSFETKQKQKLHAINTHFHLLVSG